jgi:hypothetical protein
MKLLTTALCIFFVLNCTAQKNVIPVSGSAITGISLPAESKQDKRMIFVSATKILLEMVSKKQGAGISKVELLYLPATYTLDSLKTTLQNANWTIAAVDGEKDYYWLQQNNRQVLSRFSAEKKGMDLYFGEAEQAVTNITSTTPVVTVNTENTNTIPVNNTPPVEIQNTAPPVPNDVPLVSATGFTFTTTNFDDGWISTVQEDWVQVTKGSIKILIHYPNAKADAYNSVLKEGDYNAWNTLVAPRYSNMSNFEWKSIQSWQSITFVEADATETATGKKVHIVLFKEHYSNGSGAYLEFITDTKAGYENEFGAYRQESYGWEKTANMQFRNKFAIGASDLTGTWTNNFTGMTQYVNAYTGASAGADTHASSQKFIFGENSTYKWDIAVANGFVGNIKFQSAKSNGKYTMPGAWQIHFSEMEGKPKTYDAYFSCVKWSRLLWLSDVTYPGYSAFGKAD